MEGQKWWKMTLLKVWSPGRSLVGRSLSGQSISRPKYISGPKYYLGRSCFRAEVYKRAEVFSGPKYFRAKVFRAKVFWAEVFLGRSECRAKAVSGPNWVWAYCDIWNWSSSHAYNVWCIKNLTIVVHRYVLRFFMHQTLEISDGHGARLNLFECHFIKELWKTQFHMMDSVLFSF